ncbi:DUF6602 domain-containing protein [Chryseobacterium sp. CCH4-E10]|uniref:DUF6602 domain-containing protein n=1 Tax=Chryseobacterium sp. CCH4-E10 TaxID=1768758 RepID=UPI0008372065|nr:DUF6602 domain-containing protein [Chryseobacterium sp. CCH4-E10]
MAKIEKIPLKELFASMQNQMSAQLSTNRANIIHSGSKGDALENAWIEWLRKYLPSRYSVDKAIVIDFEGNISHQMDIVIYDNWFTPFIFTQNGFHYIPAEGVYAVFEVKPDISGSSDKKHNIIYAGEKIESVRKLNRGSAKFINGGKSGGPRPLTKILGGILASTKSGDRTNNETLIKHFKKQKNLKSLDIGCIADYGSFYIDYEPKREITDQGQEAYLKHYKERIYKDSYFSSTENSLVTFFMQLTRHLQQSIGTVPAINLNKYLENIGERVDEDI